MKFRFAPVCARPASLVITLSAFGTYAAMSVTSVTPVFSQTPAAASSPAPNAKAADDKAQKAANANQVGSGLKLDFGYRSMLDKARTNSYYYRVAFDGNVLKQEHTPFSETNDFSGPGAPAKPAADTYDYLLRIDRGIGKYDGALFNALKVTDLKAPFLAGLRGAAQTYGKFDGGQVDFAVGLETPSQHLFRREAGISNFLILGIQAGTQASNAAASGSGTAHNDVGAGTYRMFFGRVLSMVRSNNLDDERLVLRSLSAQPAVAPPAPVVTSTPDTPDETLPLNKYVSNYAAYRDQFYKNELAVPPNFSEATKTDLRGRYQDGLQSLPIVYVLHKPATGAEGKDVREVRVPEFIRELRSAPPADAPVPQLREVIRKFIEGGERIEQTLANGKKSVGYKNDPKYMPAKVVTSRTIPGFAINDPELVEARNTLREYEPGTAQSAQEPTPKQYLALQTLLQSLQSNVLMIDAADEASVTAFFDTKLGIDHTAAAVKPIYDIATLVQLKIVDTTPTIAESKFEQQYASRLLLELAFPQSVFGLSGRPEDKNAWDYRVRLFADNVTFLADHPAQTLWLEGAGQYYFAGDSGNGTSQHINNIIAATYTFYLNPRSDKRQWARLRYENGRDRSAPTQYRNFLTATLGLDF